LLGGGLRGDLHQKRIQLESAVVVFGEGKTCKLHVLPRSSPGCTYGAGVELQTAELLLKTRAYIGFILCCLALLCPLHQ
jgi:hypothetical protein